MKMILLISYLKLKFEWKNYSQIVKRKKKKDSSRLGNNFKVNLILLSAYLNSFLNCRYKLCKI